MKLTNEKVAGKGKKALALIILWSVVSAVIWAFTMSTYAAPPEVDVAWPLLYASCKASFVFLVTIFSLIWAVGVLSDDL